MNKSFTMFDKMKVRKTELSDNPNGIPPHESLEELVYIPPTAFDPIRKKECYEYLECGLWVSNKKVSLDSLKNIGIYEDYWGMKMRDCFSIASYQDAIDIPKAFGAKVLTLAEYFCTVDYLERQEAFDARPMLRDMTIRGNEWLLNTIDLDETYFETGHILVKGPFDDEGNTLDHFALVEKNIKEGYFYHTQIDTEIGVPFETMKMQIPSLTKEFYWFKPNLSEPDTNEFAVMRELKSGKDGINPLAGFSFKERYYWGKSGVRLCYKI